MQMFRWSDGRKPIKKYPRWAWAIVLLVYIIALYLMFMPKTFGQAEISGNYIKYVVEGGDTLWTIASHYRPDADPREIVWEIQQVNGCTPVIYPGQTILVPEVE